ncbi:MAG TPA: hypothetical protein V6C58_04035 [Allocoleopsis sp.]
MPRKKHDQFAKEYIKELLTPLGEPKTSSDVNPETLQIDVLFKPSAKKAPPIPYLGLIANMVKTVSVFEIYRNPPSDAEVHSCKLKLYFLEAEIIRQAKRENRSLKKAELPFLWILTPTYSARMLEGFGAKEDKSNKWGKGIYFLPKLEKTAIIVINQLPENAETILLRVLGNGNKQKRAIEELKNLPLDSNLRQNLMELLANWYVSLRGKTGLSEKEQEEFMQLTEAYLKIRDGWKEEGRAEGLQEGRAEVLQEVQQKNRELFESLLQNRFGTLDDDLRSVIDEIIKLSVPELSTLLMNINNISRSDLLTRFGRE